MIVASGLTRLMGRRYHGNWFDGDNGWAVGSKADDRVAHRETQGSPQSLIEITPLQCVLFCTLSAGPGPDSANNVLVLVGAG